MEEKRSISGNDWFEEAIMAMALKQHPRKAHKPKPVPKKDRSKAKAARKARLKGRKSA